MDQTLLKYTHSSKAPSCTTIDIPRPGYYLNQQATGDADRYIACPSSGHCYFLAAPTETSTCTDDQEGQLILNRKNEVLLCTKFNYYEKMEGYIVLINTGMVLSESVEDETINANERYLIRQSNNDDVKSVFNFNDLSIAQTYYVVKRDEKSLVFDPQFNAESDPNPVRLACADTSGKVIDHATDFCHWRSSGMWYTCRNGRCEARYQISEDLELRFDYDNYS